MTWLVIYVSRWQFDQQRSEPWVCPSSMDSTTALSSLQLQNRSATVLSIAAAPQEVEA
jgi:hypothetical protein